MKKLILVIILFFTVINLRSFLINRGFFNSYDYVNNAILIKEIEQYIKDDLFKKTKLKSPLYSSYKKYSFLNENVLYAQKFDDGVLFLLKADFNVYEYIYYCYTCNFESYNKSWGFSNHIMKKDYDFNIVKINDNIYHAFKESPLYYDDEVF